MSKSSNRNKVTCPDCYTEQRTHILESRDCPECQRLNEEAKVEATFREFMAADEEQRWRRLWECAGEPTPY